VILKVFYAVVSLLNALSALWMLLFPFSWYTDFPAAVHHTGPFNPHFVRDIGVVYLTVAIGFAWCALRPDRSLPVHLGITIFLTGHALIHLFEILTGQLPASHWLIDTPLVFLPAVIMIVLAVPSIRRRFGYADAGLLS
jgi:hypothetical protein